MKKIGLVGGISWTSTLDYYKYLNQGINSKLGGLNSALSIFDSEDELSIKYEEKE